MVIWLVVFMSLNSYPVFSVHAQISVKNGDYKVRVLGLLSPRIISQPDNATFPGRGGGHLMHDIKKKTFVLLEFLGPMGPLKF